MRNRGAILKRLREINKLTIKQAAKRFNRSVGWLSSVENDCSKCKISDAELQNILQQYAFEEHRLSIHGWLSSQKSENAKTISISYDGAVLKYLRKKSGKSLEEASKILMISIGHLAKIENGYLTIPKYKRDLIVSCYGYSPESFNNFNSADKRSSSIPAEFRLQILLRHLDESRVASVFEFAKALLNHDNQ